MFYKQKNIYFALRVYFILNSRALRTLSLDITSHYVRSPMAVEHSAEGIYGSHSHDAKFFEQIEHSGIR